MADSLRDMIDNGVRVMGTPEAAGLSIEDVADALIDKQQRNEVEKAEAYRAAMIRRRQNKEAVGRDADEFLDAAGNFETKGRYVVDDRYPDPFGIPVRAADPEQPDSETKEQDQRRERGGSVLVNGREDLSVVRGATSSKGINSLVKDGAIRREWRERPGLAPGAVDPTQGADRLQFFTDHKYVGGRFNDDVAKDDGREKARMSPVGIGMGGPNGLATQLADMVYRGELDPNTPLPNPNQGRDVNGNALPDERVRTVGDLINEMVLELEPGDKKQADIAIGRAAVQRDRERFDSGLQEKNDRRAAREAQVLAGRFNPVNDFSDIGNIQSLGIASKKFNRGSNMSVFSVVPNADDTFTDRDGGMDQMVQYLTEEGVDQAEGRIPQMPGTDTSSRTTIGAQNLIDAVRMIGPEGQTVGYVDNQGSFIGDVDISPNAQPPTKTQAWLEASLPDMGRQGGTSFGYPQVNIGDELALLNQRLGPNAPQGGIRSLEDLENTFVRMIDQKLDSGEALFNFDPETRKTSAIADPGISEVLYRLGYTQNETTRLASSLNQLEAARRSPVNQEFKMLYEQGIYDPRGQFAANGYDNSVSLRRVADEKVGRGDKKGDRKAVRGELRKLDGKTEVFADRGGDPIYGVTPYDVFLEDDNGNVVVDKFKRPVVQFKKGTRALLPEVQQDLIDAGEALEDAKKPFIGVPASQTEPKRAFIRGDARGMSQSALARRMGTERAAIAQAVESRYLADERRRESPETTSPGRRAIKAQDAKIGAEGAKRKEQDRRNAARAVKAPGVGESMLVKLGLTPEQQRVDLLKVPLGGRFPDKSKPTTSQRTRLEREIVANAESAEAKRLQVAAGVDLRSQGVANGQRATSAITTQSPDPTPLVARGGWASKQLPPGQRGGDLAIREARSIRNNPAGSILDNRVERVNVQIDASELNNERSNRAPKQDPRSNQNRNRNRLIRDILGTTAAGAGSVALGAAIGSTYNRDEQSNNGGRY